MPQSRRVTRHAMWHMNRRHIRGDKLLVRKVNSAPVLTANADTPVQSFRPLMRERLEAQTIPQAEASSRCSSA
jgi:hypothetical protein